MSLVAASSEGKCPRVATGRRTQRFKFSIALVVQVTFRTASVNEKNGTISTSTRASAGRDRLFLPPHPRQTRASPPRMVSLTCDLVAAIERFADEGDLDLVRFRCGECKDDATEKYLCPLQMMRGQHVPQDMGINRLGRQCRDVVGRRPAIFGTMWRTPERLSRRPPRLRLFPPAAIGSDPCAPSRAARGRV